jgi:hypothetical protein
MATKEINVKPGETVPDVIEAAVRHLFGQEALSKAREKGAKLRFTVTSPWPKPPVVKKVKLIIDEPFVARLKDLAADETQLEGEISKFNGPDILKIAALLKIPMSKSSKVQSLRAQLLKSLRSEIVWKSIAGQSTPTNSTQSKEPEEN